MPNRKKPANPKTPEEKSGVTRSQKKKEAGLPPAKRKSDQDLVIVESPAKAKTINRYLGSNFRVVASYGHVRDLPTRAVKGEEIAGVRIADGWQARYVVSDRKGRGKAAKMKTPKEILAELKREADRSSRVFLATDPDREGEAIAWHIEDELGLDDDRTFRITFNEITKAAVEKALANPSKINRDRVKAQEARRILDRVVGFPLSELLGAKVTRGLSAGRVQSVAVRMIVEREYEIEQFKTEEYWRVHALLAPQDADIAYTAAEKSKILAKKKGEDKDDDDSDSESESSDNGQPKAALGLPKPPQGSFIAELARWDGKEFKAGDEAAVDAVLGDLQTQNYVVSKIEQKDRQERPQPPFTTSTLQQQANIRLRFSSSRTMSIAQELYQGVGLGSEGSVALITYMRTDSTRISGDALKMVRDHIHAEFGDRYLPEKAHSYASGKSAQEAHEAIRPTDVRYTPDRVRPHLTADQFRLYELIYNRFVASQMASAVFAITNVEVTAGKGLFKAQGKIERFDGYRRVLAPAGRKQEDVILPSLADQQALDKLDLFGTQHFTQPPPRYNEASLVKALEKEGIGRPSTYATIIDVIQRRGYVEQQARRFYATEMGKLVTKLLIDHFPRLMDLKFTSHMEDELDEIETGQTHYEEVLNEFWSPFSQAIEVAREQMPKLKGVEVGEKCPKCGRPLLQQYSKITGKPFIGCSGWNEKENPCKYKRSEGRDNEPQPTEHQCPACGKTMLKRTGRFGEFLTCEGAPECPTTMNVGPNGELKVTALPTNHECPKCSAKMIRKEWKGKPFLSCSRRPDCDGRMDLDEQGNPIKPIDTGEKCEKCQSPMIVKRGPRGPFLSCSAFPKCRNAKPLTDELKEKLKDQLPAMPEKKKVPEIEVSQTCPDCGGPMKVRAGRGGKPFLGCKKYPKCRGTHEAPQEVIEKWEAAQAKVES